MKIGVLGDLHGRNPFLNWCGVDVLIVPGDVCGDHGIREFIMQSLKMYWETGSAPQWYDVCGRRKARVLIDESLARGRHIFRRVNALGMPVLVIPGNWDWTGGSEWSYLQQDKFSPLFADLENVISIDGELAVLDDVGFIGYGSVNGPELSRLRGADISDEEHAEQEQELAWMVEDFGELFEMHPRSVLVSHNVPYDTKLDKINNSKSPSNGKHFGSVLARRLIDKHKPPLCIGAHMHETFGRTKIGSTLCLNAGYGRDKHSIVHLKNGHVTRVVQFPPKKVVVRP